MDALPYRWGRFQGWVLLISSPIIFVISIFFLTDPGHLLAGPGESGENALRLVLAPFGAATGLGIVKKRRFGLWLAYGWLVLYLCILALFVVGTALNQGPQTQEQTRALAQTIAAIVIWAASVRYYRRRRTEFTRREKTAAPRKPRMLLEIAQRVTSVSSKKIAFLALLVSALLLGIFVWPTRYRYDRLKRGDNEFPLRIDRITGRGEIFVLGIGWSSFVDDPKEPTQELRPDDLARLEVKASITPAGYIECEVYNGSVWTVDELGVDVTVDVNDVKFKELENDPEWKASLKKLGMSQEDAIQKLRKVRSRPIVRKYVLFKSSGTSEPMHVSTWSADLGLKLETWETWSWKIVRAGLKNTSA